MGEGGGEGDVYLFSHIVHLYSSNVLLWNHFYSNPRLRRPPRGRVAGRDGCRDGMRRRYSFKLYYSLRMM